MLDERQQRDQQGAGGRGGGRARPRAGPRGARGRRGRGAQGGAGHDRPRHQDRRATRATEIVAEAKAEAEKVIERAREEITAEKEKALASCARTSPTSRSPPAGKLVRSRDGRRHPAPAGGGVPARGDAGRAKGGELTDGPPRRPPLAATRRPPSRSAATTARSRPGSATSPTLARRCRNDEVRGAHRAPRGRVRGQGARRCGASSGDGLAGAAQPRAAHDPARPAARDRRDGRSASASSLRRERGIVAGRGAHRAPARGRRAHGDHGAARGADGREDRDQRDGRRVPHRRRSPCGSATRSTTRASAAASSGCARG